MMHCEDIAIIGAGCRFPGADNLDEFWQVLEKGENHVKEIPLERWNTEPIYDANKDAAGKIYVKRAGLIYGYDEFDPGPFGISDAEAERMDPQQRFVLECVNMALEDAGLTRASISGTQTGVYIGCMNDDYKALFKSCHHEDNSYSASGCSTSIIANRVSYVYNLHGPSIAVDTACSSALAAVHLARQAILAGDCDMAICGGVSSIISPDTFIPLCRAQLMSALGQCQTFCNTADGYARSEGCGIIILKKLNPAITDGNKIWATVKTVMNTDGHAATPITSPSEEQQIKLLESCYSDTCGDQTSVHGIDAASVQYIEAHGTGTIVGDPVEANALGRFFSQNRKDVSTDTEQLLIGSVKTNIGHTESAAGVAGLIKVLLMMQHGKTVPSLFINTDMSNLNPAINLIQRNIRIASDVREWKPNKFNSRIGCINSFGFGGSNCHCVLLQRQSLAMSNSGLDIETEKEPLIVTLSAVDKDSLTAVLEKFRQDIRETPDSISSISYTSTCLRDHFRYRLAFTVTSKEELIEKAKNTSITDIRPYKKANIIFVYCGMGTTWTGMCSELVVKNKAFREAVMEIDRYLQPLAGISMVEVFKDPTAKYIDPFLNQIALFSGQVGLTEMWRCYGIHPDAIIGLSVGEVAAAYTSGALDMKNAVDVIYYRSKYLAECSGGTMLVVKGLDVATVEMLCEKYDKQVTIGVYLSPVACTVSGETEIMAKVKADIESIKKEKNTGIFLKDLRFHCAYHSHRVEPCLPKLQRAIMAIQSRDRKTCIYSSVTGKVAATDEFQTAEYWINNVRQPVRAAEAILSSAHKDENNILIEIGPHPFVGPHIADIFKNSGMTSSCLPSVRKKQEVETKNTTVVKLYENGVNIDWKCEHKKSHISSLPKYTFRRRKLLYIPDPVKRQFREGISSSAAHEHLFVQSSTNEEAVYHVRIGKETTPFVFDHFLSGKVLVPAALYVEAAFAISRKTLNILARNIKISLKLSNTLTLKDQNEIVIDCEVCEAVNGVELTFRKEKRILCSVKCRERKDITRKQVSIQSLRASCSVPLSKTQVYTRLKTFGYQYGKSMSLIEQAWCSDTECLAELILPQTVINGISTTTIHPAVLDAMLQMAGILNNTSGDTRQVFPKAVESVTALGYPEQRMFCFATVTGSGNSKTHVNILLMDSCGNSVCEICDFTTKEIDMEHDIDRYAYSLNWHLLKDSIQKQEQLQSSNIIAWCTKIAKDFIEPLCDESYVKYCMISSECEIETSQLEMVTSNMKPDLYQAAIFAPFFDLDLTLSKTYQIYSMAKKTLISLKRVLTALSHGNFCFPLFIITKNTQVNTTNPSRGIRLLGSELWGFVRSISHEPVYPELRLLDVDPAQCDKKRFMQIVKNGYPSQTELKLEGPLVFSRKLEAYDSFLDDSLKKFVCLQEREEACLRSTVPTKISTPFFRSIKSEKPANVQDGTVRLRLKSACLHHEAFYPLTADVGEGKHTIWPDITKDGFQTFCLEGEGVTEAKADSGASSTACVKYFCYPVNIGSHVTVPEMVIFDQSDIPSYIPGLLTLSVVLFYLASKITASSCICICTADRDEHCHKLLQAYLGSKNVCLIRKSEIVKHGFNSKYLKDAQCLILLCKVEKHDVEHLLILLPKLMEFITLPYFIPEHVQKWLICKHRHVAVSLERIEFIFHERNLAKILPHVQKVLNQKQFNLHENRLIEKEMNDAPFSLPQRQLVISTYRKQLLLCPGDSQLFKQNSCYIVVGGFTGLGWIVMQWIAKMGGGHLRSVSRRDPSVDQEQKIQSLMNNTNCSIKSIKADITDLQKLISAFHELQAELADVPVKGIFIGAGVLDDCLMENMTEEKLETVLLPKILGCMNMHVATKDMELEFFIIHSSIASVLGNPGQSNYGAGNSFADALAHYRRSQNLRAQSINWGPLKDIGMLENRPDSKSQLSKSGFNFIDENDVRACLEHVVLSDEGQTIFGSFNWPLIGKNLTSSKLEDLIPQQVSTAHRLENGYSYEFDMDRYLEATEKNKSSIILELVQYVCGHVFPMADKSLLSNESNIYELGLDSFTATNFVKSVYAYTKYQIPFPVMLSDDTTVGSIVTLLEQNVGRQMSPNHVKDPLLDPNAKLSFIERSVLVEFEDTQNKKLLEVFDMAFEGNQWNSETWFNILKHVIQINPGVCKHYIKKGRDIEVEQASDPAAAVEIEIIPIEEMAKDDPRDKIEFDLSRELPIKFLIGKGTSRTILRTVLHPLIADLSTALIFGRDLTEIGYARINKKELPKRKEMVEIAPVLHSKVNQAGENSKSFWRKQLGFVTKPITLGTDLELKPLDNFYFKLIKGSFPDEMRQRIFDFIQAENVTLYQFFMSVYALFLYMETEMNNNIIPVVSPVDLRIYSKELENIAGRCVNDIIHIAVFNEKQSFREFLQSNAEKIVRAVSNSLYPYEMILQELPSKELQENIGRHRLCPDDISEFGQSTMVGHVKVTLDYSWTVSDQFETYLGITIDKKSELLSYEFGYNSAICGEEKDGYFPDKLMALLNKCTEQPNENVTVLAAKNRVLKS